MAVSVLDISYSEARQMLVWEFNQRIKGKHESNMEGWRQARWIASVLLSPHLKKGVRPQQLLPLPGDIPPKRMSADEIEGDVIRKLKLFEKHRKN